MATDNMTLTINLTDTGIEMETFNITDRPDNVTTTTTASVGGFGDPSCDHIPGFVSKETVRQLKEFSAMYASILGYVLSTICAVGVVTCSMAVIVLTRKNMKFSGSIILTWLAVAELMKSAIYLPYVVNSFLVLSRSRYGFPYSSPEEGWAIYHLSALIGATTCQNISIGLTISLAVFRCIYILFPNKAPKYCSPFRSKIAVIVTISCSLVINMPSYYIFTWYKDPFTGADTYIVYMRLEVNKKVYEIHDYINSIVMKFVPSALLIVLTMILIISMNRAFKIRQKEERRVTNMLLSVVILFAFEESFHAFLILLSRLVECFEEIFYYHILPELIETITFSTSIVNCLLYVSMSKRFRITFLKLFCPGYVLRNRPDWVNTSTRIGFQNPHPGRRHTDASSHQKRDASSHQRDASSHQKRDASSHQQRDASSHQQRDTSSQEHGAELYDDTDNVVRGIRHATESNQHRISVDSTSV